MELRKIFEEIETAEEQLTNWERSFVDSVEQQFREKGSLSPRQVDKLTEIYERVI